MDLEQNHQEMSREEAVQEDVNASVSLHLHLKWRNRLEFAAQEASDVREDGGLLGGRIPNNS